MRYPHLFPKYPTKLDKHGRFRIRIHGRDYYLPKPIGCQASIAEYERLRLEHAAGHIQPSLPAKVGLTVSELLAAWLAADPRGAQDKEVRGICRACVPMEHLFGHTRAGEFTAMRLKALQDAMVSGSWRAGDYKNAWSRTYINMQIARVCRLFRWAETEGHVSPGTWQHLRTLQPLKKNDRRVRNTLARLPVDWEAQVKPALPYMTPQVAAMVQVQFFGGMRPGEVCTMRRCEIDQSGPSGTWLYKPSQHKNEHRGQELVKVLGPQAQTILAPWLLAAEPNCFVFPPTKRRYSRGHYTVEGYGRAIARAVAIANVKPWSAYQLRHLSKQIATRTFGLDHARAHLGQRSLGATAGYAAQIDLHTAAEVARRIG